MPVKKWSKQQRRKFMATMRKQRRTVGWGRAKKTKNKPYRRPRIIDVSRNGKRELLIRIEIV